MNLLNVDDCRTSLPNIVQFGPLFSENECQKGSLKWQFRSVITYSPCLVYFLFSWVCNTGWV